MTDHALKILMVSHHRRSKVHLAIRSLAIARYLAKRGHHLTLLATADYRKVGIVEGWEDGVRIVEILNGGSRHGEDEIAREMAKQHHYLGIGGSDAHIVSHIGRCATRFPAPVNTEGELVEALRAEEFEAITLKS